MRRIIDYEAESDAFLKSNILALNVQFPGYLPSDAVDLMRKLMAADPSKRITISEVRFS